MLASLEAADRAQQRFVSDASHELRAPLTIIQANLDLIERSANLSLDEQRAIVAEANREVRRLTQLVADLLALARADAGVALQHRPVEFDRLLIEAVGEARSLAHGQRLVVAGIEPLVVRGDPDRLKQLVLILLDNALKYTPAEREVAVALARDGAWAVLEVRDEGVGIPPDAVPLVFERFYRADPARSRDPGGTGLGLPIARWIAEQHDGTIVLTSDLEHGTQVVVRVPVSS
jgi:signal transduction histidine kinase